MFEQIRTRYEEDSANDPVGQNRRLVVGLSVAVLMPAAIFLLFYFGTPKQVPWAISGKTLQIHAGIAWSEDYNACELQTAKARVIDLAADPAWLPAKKIYGYDGGSSYGNFYLQNGKEVEIALAHETKAVLLPREGKVPVLIGVSDSDALLNALRKACI